MLPLPNLTIDDIIRFWSKTIRKGVDDCWNWIGGCTGNEEHRRRPVFKVKHTNYIAARIAWKIEYKTDPGEYLVCHKCSPKGGARQLCVNPNHLWLGTYSDNLADAASKGEAPTRNQTDLLDCHVRQIRQLYNSGESPARLGEMFNLSRNQIWRIVKHKCFATVED